MVNWRSADGAPSAARSGPAESPTETVKGSEAVGSAEAIAGVPELEETGVPARVVVPPSSQAVASARVRPTTVIRTRPGARLPTICNAYSLNVVNSVILAPITKILLSFSSKRHQINYCKIYNDLNNRNLVYINILAFYFLPKNMSKSLN
jgi:hypothetical protein